MLKLANTKLLKSDLEVLENILFVKLSKYLIAIIYEQLTHFEYCKIQNKVYVLILMHFYPYSPL